MQPFGRGRSRKRQLKTKKQSLDDTIEAKKQDVAGLTAKADERLQDFHTIKERGNWQGQRNHRR